MKVLILGPNSSGKSAFAEKLALTCGRGRPLYYIATMIPFGDEGRARVQKHRKQRESMGFVTLEIPFAVSEVQIPSNAVVLLEDVSNLLGNALSADEKNGDVQGVLRDIMSLSAKCRACLLVSIDGLTARPEYDEETNNYIAKLSQLNAGLFDFADKVAKMRDGEPVYVKGDKDALD